MADPQVICVLGMHRGGTSLVTRVLNLLGVYLGDAEHMMMPQPDNPKGFWEHRLIHEVNEAILSRLGGSWHEPPDLRAGWEMAPELADLRQRARGLIQDTFRGAPLWGWKDPRTCLTLPFWQRLTPRLRFVVCLRNPLDTARSLERRDGFVLDKGVALWLRHVTSALAQTSGQPRLLIFYEDVMSSWDRELRRLSDFIGAPERSRDRDVQDAVRAFVDAELQHHRTDVIDTVEEGRLSFPAKALYLVLRSYVSLRAGGPAEEGAVDPMDAALDHFGAYAPPPEQARREEAREREVQQLRMEGARLEQELEAQRVAHRQASELVGQLEAQRLTQEQELQRRQTHISELTEHLDVILRSKSWRLTAPLRRLAAAVRGVRLSPPIQSIVAGRGGGGPSALTARPRSRNETDAAETSARALLVRLWKDGLRLFLSDCRAKLAFPSSAGPLVSIVIPTFNKAEYLYQCLSSLLAHTSDVPYELIVVDDCSRDDTPSLLERLEHVTVVRNEENLEFIGACNRGAGLARGQYLLFLNNDVTVTPKWLSTLVATMERDPRCGAVQGILIRPDGTLQEAGTIIWRDGSALAYGRGDDPLRPEYGYVREVDYCSAACLLVRAELFRQLGGFDERYRPAFYEDVDLCFGVRQRGFTVVLQPQAGVFHFEWGSRSAERAAALCRVNQTKFAAKWAGELARHYRHGEVLRARDRRTGPRVLVIDDQVPAPYLGSGFPRAYKMLELLSELGFVTTFVPVNTRTKHQPVTQRLQQRGVEVFYGDSFSIDELLRDRAGYYDVVIVSRPHNAAKFLRRARQSFPGARIVYDAEALFCMRQFRKAELDGRALSELEKQEMLRRELDIMRPADVVVTVSQTDRDTIVAQRGHPHVVVWGHPQEARPARTPFADRKDLLFVGGFLDGHPPNTDAVRYFATELFPRIRQKLSACRFVVVGADPPRSIRDLASADVLFTGYVEDLEAYYESCRVFVVPIRFGAGISLKLLEAMGQGIPAVVSAVGAASLDLRDGREALIADSDQDFVEKVIRLYDNEQEWVAVQRDAQEYVRRSCSPERLRNKLAEILEDRAEASSG